VQQGKQGRVLNDRFSGWSKFEAAGYSKIQIRYNVRSSRKLQYPETFWFWRCWVSQLLQKQLLPSFINI